MISAICLSSAEMLPASVRSTAMIPRMISVISRTTMTVSTVTASTLLHSWPMRQMRSRGARMCTSS